MKNEEKEVAFFIGDHEYKSEHRQLSVKTLLVDFAKQNPAHTLLARKHEPEPIVYTDLEEIIHIENGMRFFIEKIDNKIEFFIDKEKFKTDEHHLSVKVLLVDFAKENPAETTLAHKEGDKLIKYTNLDEIIHIKNGMRFCVLHNGPTPVS